jgi:hypothetical protein
MISKHPQPSATEREAATRRAIIGVVPDYFGWSAEAQERYRATLPKEDRSRIRQSLLKSLFGINTATCADTEAVIDSFDDAQYLLLNCAMLPLTGIGDDCFFLNESMAEGTSLLDFETLYDYDHADHCFQQAVRQQDDPGFVAKPYRGTHYWRWARLQIGGVFHYANLSLLAGYVGSKLDELGFDQINALIPHRFVDGKDHGKREGEGIRFDLRVDAGGMEGQLDELNERYYRYLSSRVEALLVELDAKAPKRVYMVDTSRDVEPCRDFVFTDKTALQAVRFLHFMRDCQAILGDPAELDELLHQENQAASEFLEQSHQDILKNFDPKVVKLRKKRKILLSDEAAKDLL